MLEIKIVRNPHDDQRLAYVNFQRPDSARKIRRSMVGRLTRLLGHRLHVDPAGVIRDQEGKYIPDRYNRALQAGRDTANEDTVGYNDDSHRARTPADHEHRHSRRVVEHSGRSAANGSNSTYEWKLRQCLNEAATRTLFIGNMPADVKEREIRKVFERYGQVEDVDIKTPADTNAAYAFVQFETLDQALSAKRHENDRPIRSGSTRIKIGYGKPLLSNRLWIGGLGNWTSMDTLVGEFDRYGLIEEFDYRKGADQAFIRFADANAAADAHRAMSGFPLGGRDRCIIVDFVKDLRGLGKPPMDLTSDRKRRHSVSPDDQHQHRHRHPTPPPPPPLPQRHHPHNNRQESTSIQPARRGPRTPPDSPPPSPPAQKPRYQPSEPKPAISSTKANTVSELEAVVSPCWTGALVLKKNAYAVRLHKLTGDDDLVDGLLRDDTGESIKLHVTQRLPFAGQTGLIDRLSVCPSDHLSFLLAVSNTNASDVKLADGPARPLKSLVSYLTEKSAAGVVGLRNCAVLYVFPNCPLALALLQIIAPKISVLANCADDCLLLALVKNGLKAPASLAGSNESAKG